MIADVMSWRLDRRRPLWEIWVIGGLADDRWALLMKVHQCIADAGATAHMLTGLSDNGFGDAAVAAPRDAARPPHHRPVPDLNPLHWIDNLRGVVELATGLLQPAESPLNGPITSRRRYSAARVALADVEQICRAFDVTVNDVVLAALTESYRDFMIRRGQVPQPDSLRTLVPVATAGEEARQAQNRVSLLLPNLPIEESHPVRRLLAVRSRLAHAKAGRAAPCRACGHVGRRPATGHLVGVGGAAARPAPPTRCGDRGDHGARPRGAAADHGMRRGAGPAGATHRDATSHGRGDPRIRREPVRRDAGRLRPRRGRRTHPGPETAVGRLVARSKRRRPLRDWHGLGLVHSA